MSEIPDLHEPILKWLREQRIECVRARSDRRSTIESGWPDLTLLHPARYPLLIELKTEKGALDKDQIEVHARLRDRGFHVHVIRSYDAAILLISAWRDGIGNDPPMKPLGKIVQFGNARFEERDGQLFRLPALR